MSETLLPHFISAIVTDYGIFAPHAVREYFDLDKAE
jgi:hypothetical protein